MEKTAPGFAELPESNSAIVRELCLMKSALIIRNADEIEVRAAALQGELVSLSAEDRHALALTLRDSSQPVSRLLSVTTKLLDGCKRLHEIQQNLYAPYLDHHARGGLRG